MENCDLCRLEKDILYDHIVMIDNTRDAPYNTHWGEVCTECIPAMNCCPVCASNKVNLRTREVETTQVKAYCRMCYHIETEWVTGHHLAVSLWNDGKLIEEKKI